MELIESSSVVLPILCVGLFAGVQVSIRFSSFPAMLSLDDHNAVRFFSHFYPPLATVQPSLLVVAALTSLLRLTFTTTSSSLTYYAHLLDILHTVWVLGWTGLVMLSDNNKLLAAAASGGKKKETRQGDMRKMLVNWGTRNEARVWPVLVLFALLVVAETGKQ
jgi:hypothetical protein